ncbi:MAG: Hsp20/alpha crystallin family protein [Nitrospira sp.]|nr:Hsp20/alpha crystallin family protein [bacterium]MBL7049239.1 Hsp20/alpha crystallin family protein [Nitrospira sp.]
MLWSNNVNWLIDQWDELERMRRVMSGLDRRSEAEFPPVNTWISSDDSVVTTEIPGVVPEDLDITVTGRTVTLRGSRRVDDAEAGQRFHRRERWSGDFTKAIELPFKIEADKVKAQFKKGVLYLTLPKAEDEKPKKIEIKSS